MIFREILSLPFAAFWSNFFIPFPAKYIPILRGGHSKVWCLKGPPPLRNGKKHGKQNVSKGNSVSCIFSVWDVYWCSQNQTWTSRAGSRTPSLDSKMCQFPGIFLSELWKVRSFRLIPVNNRPKNEALELDAGFRLWRQFLSKNKPGIICSGQIWFFKPKSAVGKWSSKGNVNGTAQKDNVRHILILSVAMKWCHHRETDKPHFLKMTCVTYLNNSVGKFVHYHLPPSEVISSFLFLRNTFQVLGRHSKCSKCDVWRVPHHWETGKTWQNKWFKRKILKCPQS